jgi:hypothetical protein
LKNGEKKIRTQCLRSRNFIVDLFSLFVCRLSENGLRLSIASLRFEP